METGEQPEVTMIRWFFFWTGLLLAGIASAGEPPRVAVSIAPEAYLVENIAGPDVDVMTVLRAGSNAATFSPSPSTLRALEDRAVYFSIGVPFEHAWLPALRKTLPALRIVALDADLPRLEALAHDHAGHAHGYDPHVWTSPANLRRMAERIRDTLIEMRPADAKVFQRNWRTLDARLRALDEAIRARLRAKRGAAFMVFHPAWGYFAHDYGLRQIVIEPFGKQVGPRRLMRLIQLARRERIGTVFVQPQFSERQARLIAEAIGGRVARLDPLAHDIVATLRAAADAFAGDNQR